MDNRRATGPGAARAAITARRREVAVARPISSLRPNGPLGLQPVAVAAEVQRPKLRSGLADQIALTHHYLLSAVELDVLTTFAAKRSPEAPDAL
jgi:hypothetical protein